MANYRSYKKVAASQVPDGSITIEKLANGVGPSWCVKTFYGDPGVCTPGCCCNWTVPAGVAKLTWELWGAGGNGHGACSCRRCHHYRGAGGGSFTTKTIDTTPGCSYTVCAAGVYRCCSRECTGCYGCASYVNGYNLSNFCAVGGGRGEANTDWSNLCHSTIACCVQPGSYNSDFGMNAHWPGFSGHWSCHCGLSVTQTCSGGAPFIGVGNKTYSSHCWIRCGCWSSPYGAGGQGAMTSYCERCCGQGGTGGSGLVRLTYM